jgi:hypothetical protein
MGLFKRRWRQETWLNDSQERCGMYILFLRFFHFRVQLQIRDRQGKWKKSHNGTPVSQVWKWTQYEQSGQSNELSYFLETRYFRRKISPSDSITCLDASTHITHKGLITYHISSCLSSTEHKSTFLFASLNLWHFLHPLTFTSSTISRHE